MTGLLTLSARLLRQQVRSPYAYMSLLQPLLWLLLFGSLFAGVSRLEAFGGQPYLHYLAPGVAVMSATVGAGFSGLALLADLERGVTRRFLATPATPAAIALAPVVQVALWSMLPVALLAAVATLAGGAPWPGPGGLAAALAATALIAATYAGLSNALAAGTEQPAAVIGVMNLLSLPLTFTSTMLMAREAMPPWMRAAAAANPVDWAVTAARLAWSGAPLGADYWGRIALLAAAAAASAAAATLALARYRARL